MLNFYRAFQVVLRILNVYIPQMVQVFFPMGYQNFCQYSIHSTDIFTKTKKSWHIPRARKNKIVQNPRDFPDKLSKFTRLFITLSHHLCMYLVFAPHHLTNCYCNCLFPSIIKLVQLLFQLKMVLYRVAKTSNFSQQPKFEASDISYFQW